MANFALEATDPIGEIIGSINYLLATASPANTAALLSNVLTANTANGEITTVVDANYVTYLYEYLDVRYADSSDGQVNFSTEPTNRYWFGVRNIANANVVYTNTTVIDQFFTSGNWTAPADTTSIQYLIVAGGGAGGTGGQGGGGGGGAVVEGNMTVLPNETYTFTIGAGATPSSGQQSNGSASNLSYTINSTVIWTALGGGGGGGEISSGAAASVAREGGSGGGGSHAYFANGTSGFNTGVNLTAANSIQLSSLGYGYGSAGGMGRGQQNGTYGGIGCSDYILVGGGGGGANVAGENWRYNGSAASITAIFGGNGGAGFTSNITDTLQYFGGGGGGGVRPVNTSLGATRYVSGAGGLGGGQGNVARTNGDVTGGGTQNTGGGGAGVISGPLGGTYRGGSGGSGYAAIRYETAIPSNPDASNNPADYVWTQVVGGFGTTKDLFYAIRGGRQIAFVVANAAPSVSYKQQVANVTIDLDRVTQIASKVIIGDNIVNETITGNLLVLGTITGNLIAANTITGNNIAANTITADKIAANAIQVNTVISTGATLGSNSSVGFWLDGPSGNARFGNGINIGNTLTVGSNASISSNLNVGANAIIGANVVVGINANIGANLIVGANANIGNNLRIGNTATIGTNLIVGANANIGANLIVGNSATIGTNLVVGTNANVGANANIGANLIVGNSATIGSNLIVGINANIGANLIVGANANIGGNLFVVGLITSGNLNNSTVNTSTIVANAVTNSNGVSVTGTIYTNNAVTLSNLGLVEAGGSYYFLYESQQFYIANSGVRLTVADANVVVGIAGQTQVQGNVYVDQDFSPFVTSQLYRKNPAGTYFAVAPKNYSLISTVFAGNASVQASQVINDFYSYTVNTIDTFTTNGVSQIHEFAWAYSVGAFVAGYNATANGNIRGTNPTVSVTQFKR